MRGFGKCWEVIYLLASGLSVSYFLRACMSASASSMMEEFAWSETQKGYYLSSFFWGYLIGQIPFSIIGQIYGAKWVFGFSVFVPSVCVLFIPIAAKASFDAVLAVQVFVGLTSSGIFPATYSFLRNWLPLSERTIMIPTVYAGSYLGTIIAFPICGVLVDSQIGVFGSWEASFYLFGTIGILWFPLWAVLIYEHPELHPTITHEELLHINHGKRLMTIADVDKREASRNNHQKQDTCSPTDINTTLSPTSLSQDVTPSVSVKDIESGLLENMCDNSSSCSQATTTLNNLPPVVGDVTTQQHKSMSKEGDVDIESGISQPDFNDSTKATTSNVVLTSTTEQTNVVLGNTNCISDNNNNNNTATTGDGDVVGVVRNRQDSTASVDKVSFLSDDAHAVEITERTPWCAFFGSMAFITLLINGFMTNFFSFMMITQLPNILLNVLKFNPGMAGILSMPPFVALLCSYLISGRIFGTLQLHYHWKVHTVRLVAQTIALIGASVSLLIVVFANDVVTSYAFLLIAQLMLGVASCGVSCGYTDISPNFSFSMNSIGNTVGGVAGLLGPIIIAEFTTKYPGIWGWRASFLLTTALSFIALAFWHLFSVSTPIHDLNTPVSSSKMMVVDRHHHGPHWHFHH